jgi:hypothetical protein
MTLVTVSPPMLHSHKFTYHWCYVILPVRSITK